MISFFIIASICFTVLLLYYMFLRTSGYTDGVVVEWTDETTGVHYLINSTGGMCPKLTKEGSIQIDE